MRPARRGPPVGRLRVGAGKRIGPGFADGNGGVVVAGDRFLGGNPPIGLSRPSPASLGARGLAPEKDLGEPALEEARSMQPTLADGRRAVTAALHRGCGHRPAMPSLRIWCALSFFDDALVRCARGLRWRPADRSSSDEGPQSSGPRLPDPHRAGGRAPPLVRLNC